MVQSKRQTSLFPAGLNLLPGCTPIASHGWEEFRHTDKLQKIDNQLFCCKSFVAYKYFTLPANACRVCANSNGGFILPPNVILLFWLHRYPEFGFISLYTGCGKVAIKTKCHKMKGVTLEISEKKLLKLLYNSCSTYCYVCTHISIQGLWLLLWVKYLHCGWSNSQIVTPNIHCQHSIGDWDTFGHREVHWIVHWNL